MFLMLARSVAPSVFLFVSRDSCKRFRPPSRTAWRRRPFLSELNRSASLHMSAAAPPTVQHAPIEEAIDNPCWGSPIKCSLQHLVRLLSLPKLPESTDAFPTDARYADRSVTISEETIKQAKTNRILYESPRYLVLNKPPDVRMDGKFPATVHKLLTLFYPSPTVLDLSKSSNSDEPSTEDPTRGLFDAVSKLHRHNHVPDNELRPCHQLDYATSGVLCVARTSEAANEAMKGFELRKARKTYLAVVRGHIATDSIEAVPEGAVDETLRSIEEEYRKRRQKKPHKKETFVGYQPAHVLYATYKSRQATSRKRNRSNRDLSWDDWEVIWKPVRAILGESDVPVMTWKDLRKDRRDLAVAFEDAAKIHNEKMRLIVEERDESEKKKITNLPLVFRLEHESTDNSEDEGEGCGRSTFGIFAAMAQTEEDFAMRVSPNLTAPHPEFVDPWRGPADLNYKPSLTKCTILERGYYRGNPVTKVRLHPCTGRRHQLRMHMALWGHPILGDVTYVGSGSIREDAPRMCLHARSLEMPLLGEPANWRAEAPDPFEFDGDRALVIA